MSANGPPQELGLLVIRNRVLFPGLLLRLTLGKPKSIEFARSLWDSQTQSFKKNVYIFVTTSKPLTNGATEAGESSEQKSDDSDVEFDLETVKIPGEAGRLESAGDPEDTRLFYKRGTVAKVLQMSRINPSAGGKLQFSMLVEGISRAEFQEFHSFSPFLKGKISSLPALRNDFSSLSEEKVKRIKALELSLRKAGSDLGSLMRKNATGKIRTLSKDVFARLENADLELLADLLTSVSDSLIEEKQSVLAEADLEFRLEKALQLVQRQIEIFKLSDKIQNNIDDKLKNTQREYYLRQQLKAIQAELHEISREKGDSKEDKNEIEELQDKLEAKHLPEEVKKVVEKEFSRLKSMQPAQPEYSVIKNYLDVIADLPWNDFTADNIDLNIAREQLEKDHFGLEKVKKRILEFLAVISLNARKKNDKGQVINAPILCLVGPPGVGKTSLGKSIAKALNRQFARIALGGVRDEAEIRGHRKTYIGALPGKIIQTYRKVKVNNPLILLDEIDKVSSFSGNRQGDVSSALLEVLDPEQNDSFTDHYLNVPFDLSKSLFLATANDLSTIPGPLLDRMEIIELSSYTMQEKVQIARKYLVPKQVERHSLETALEVEFTDEAIEKLIMNFTREAGVRSLERQIAAVCRHLAVQHLNNSENTTETKLIEKVTITKENVLAILGNEIFETDAEINGLVNPYGSSRKVLSVPGVSVGLAYTKFGGDILYIETVTHYGSGKVILTGQLGKVMSESVNAALSFIRANVGRLGIKQQFSAYGCDIQNLLNIVDFHVHFPAGAVPKDGPSAGVAICASITSALTGIALRSDTGCTGEISLRGVVLPIGGLKEKLLAAHRAGLTRVVIPYKNKKDLVDVPKEVLDVLEIFPVKSVFEGMLHLFPEKPGERSTAAPRWLFDFPNDHEVHHSGLLGEPPSEGSTFSNGGYSLSGKDTAAPELRSLL